MGYKIYLLFFYVLYAILPNLVYGLQNLPTFLLFSLCNFTKFSYKIYLLFFYFLYAILPNLVYGLQNLSTFLLFSLCNFIQFSLWVTKFTYFSSIFFMQFYQI